MTKEKNASKSDAMCQLWLQSFASEQGMLKKLTSILFIRSIRLSKYSKLVNNYIFQFISKLFLQFPYYPDALGNYFHNQFSNGAFSSTHGISLDV